jgi:hypothetical protein
MKFLGRYLITLIKKEGRKGDHRIYGNTKLSKSSKHVVSSLTLYLIIMIKHINKCFTILSCI